MNKGNDRGFPYYQTLDFRSTWLLKLYSALTSEIKKICADNIARAKTRVRDAF